MSTFDVRFVRGAIPPGEKDAALEGDGTILVGADGMSVRAKARRTRLANGLAVVVAIGATLAVVVAMVLTMDAFRIDLSPKLGGAIGLLTLVATGIGSSALLERLLPHRAITITIPWPYVVSARVNGTQVQVVTTSRELAGTCTFETPRARELVETFERARA